MKAALSASIPFFKSYVPSEYWLFLNQHFVEFSKDHARVKSGGFEDRFSAQLASFLGTDNGNHIFVPEHVVFPDSLFPTGVYRIYEALSQFCVN